MSRPAEQMNSQRPGRGGAPTPSSGDAGSDLRSVANQVEGLLDDDGHFNPDPGQLSRGHPDYDESTDPRANGDQGRDEKGRFKAKSSPADDDDADGGTADDLDQETDQAGDVDVSDEDTVDDGDTDEELDESAVSESDDDAEDTGIHTVAEMAEALEMSVEDFLGAVEHTFTAAGEETTVTLSDVLKGYQKDADYRRGTSELANLKREHEQQHTAQMEQFTVQNQQLAAQMGAMEQIIVQQLESPAMQKLRQSDPGEWTARREELGQQIRFIQQARQQAADQYNQTQANHLSGLRERSMQALKEAVPEFGSQHGDTARAVLGSLGFADSEVSKIFDHRVVMGALELDTLRKENAKLKADKESAIAAARKVKKNVPRVTKPGKQAHGKGRGVSRDNLARLQGNLRKSGRTEDAAKVIEQLI
jgi:hypothetical protein